MYTPETSCSEWNLRICESKRSVIISFEILLWLSRGPFLESPGNSTGTKSYFEIKVSRNVGCVLNSNEVNFVSLADNFTVQFSKLLKLPSGMENKIA